MPFYFFVSVFFLIHYGSFLKAQTVELSLSSINVKVFLEGPFIDKSGYMHTQLREKGYLPGMLPKAFMAKKTEGTDPYFQPQAKKNTQQHCITLKGAYPEGVVDIIQLEIKEISSAIRIKVSAYLMDDGQLNFQAHGDLRIKMTKGAYYSLAIEHRNHHRIEQEKGFVFDELIIWDTTKGSSTYAKELAPHIWGMKAGKLSKNKIGIGESDLQLWQKQRGSNSTYLDGDINFDGDVNMKDQELLLNNLRLDLAIE